MSEDYTIDKALSLMSAVAMSSPSSLITQTLITLLIPSPPHAIADEKLVSKLLFYLTTSLPVTE